MSHTVQQEVDFKREDERMRKLFLRTWYRVWVRRCCS